MDPDVNKQDNHGRTKLFMAAKEENLSKCKTLIAPRMPSSLNLGLFWADYTKS